MKSQVLVDENIRLKTTSGYSYKGGESQSRMITAIESALMKRIISIQGTLIQCPIQERGGKVGLCCPVR